MQIISEAGKNFLADTIEEGLVRAKQLALTAKNCGADLVKFQAHSIDEIVKRDKSRHDWIRLNEKMTPYFDFWIPLKNFCDQIKLEMLVTPMALGAAKMINPLVKRWKVASPDLNDWELLAYMKSTGKEIIASTGMAHPTEILSAKNFLEKYPHKFLHCISLYPCPLEELNIHRVKMYNGLSDHSMSLITGAMAVALKAEIIEKHFSMNNWGKDAHMSLNPEQLKTYIENIREAEKAMIKTEIPTSGELELRKLFIV